MPTVSGFRELIERRLKYASAPVIFGSVLYMFGFLWARLWLFGATGSSFGNNMFPTIYEKMVQGLRLID
ncbi:hypothetical protein MDG893_06550 [Marinobacter algicola DG893]|uniref:Uncharacterized protein n=1 Tax=Marinobacter algicola DG893 TaxID=443152 RepID=A6F396_9GAMM|nr:hypothetical protein MDG893_06550 [Marinobacter algicola DG893]